MIFKQRLTQMLGFIAFRPTYALYIVSFSMFLLVSVCSADELSYFSVKFQEPELSVLGKNIIQTKDGDFLLAGHLYDSSNLNSWGLIAKVSSKGNKEWQKDFGKKAQNSSFHALTNACNGEIILTGSAHGHYEGGLEWDSPWIIKIDSDGNVLWDKSLNIGQAVRAVDVKLLEDCNILVLITIRQGSMINPKDSVSVLKFDQAGNEISRKNISSPDSIIGEFIYLLPDAGFIVGGKIFSPPGFENNTWIAHFSEHGNLLWEQKFLDKRSKIIASAVLPDNSILFARTLGLSGTKLSLVKLGKDGNLLWEKNISDSDICGISAIWMSAKRKLFAAGTDCSEVSASAWVGEIYGDGKIKLFKKTSSINNARVLSVLPMSQKIAIVFESNTDSYTATWLLVESLKEIQ